MSYEYIIAASLVVNTVGSAITTLRYGKLSWIPAAISLAILLGLPVELLPYTVPMILIGAASIMALMRARADGVIHGLVSLMVLATVLSLITDNLALLLLSLMLTSAPTYILLLLDQNTPSVEASLKYVVNMVIATVIFFVGAVLMVYPGPSSPLFILGYVLLLLGLCLEVGAAPMHEWVPDVFTAGNPVPVSIIASIAKITPFIVATKVILATTNPALSQYLAYVAGAVAAISMFTGNIGALTSREVARILAYSSIANMGYVMSSLAAIAIGSGATLNLAFAGLFLQLLMNAVGKIGFFNSISSGGNNSASTWLVSLSFIGAPPLLGFWSKLYIILALIYSGFIWLAVILVINSVISIPYYVKLARTLGTGWRGGLAEALMMVTTLIVIITAIPPAWFINPLMSLTRHLLMNL